MTEDERCRHPDCIYRNRGYYAQATGQCDYLRIAGKSRIKGLPDRLQLPCNCPRYVPDSTSPVELITRTMWEEALALYRAGATDKEIAEAIGKSREGVCAWRHRNNLPCNPDQRGNGKRYDWTVARKLYDAGMCDREIAEALGCNQTSVMNWRNREGLPYHPAWDRRREKKENAKHINM